MHAFGHLGLGVALACALPACVTDTYRPLPELYAASAPQEALEVTMYNLITTPERFDGKVVRVIGLGYFSTEFPAEDVWALYPTRDDFNHVTCAVVYVDDLVPELEPQIPKLDALMDKYVRVTGTFRAAVPFPPGVIAMTACPNAGRLHDVTQIGHWEFGD